MIREAALEDLDHLVDLEGQSFSGDLLSRRNFRHLLTRGNSQTLLAIQDGEVAGYVTVLFRCPSAKARLYSIAVRPAYRACGIGTQLVRAAERTASERGCSSMRLEIRSDNEASISLFEGLGYRRGGLTGGYYEDGMSAVRFERCLDQA